MIPNQSPKPAKYSEEKEEAKHPGAALGLIMGIYPAILIAGLLIAIALIGFRSMYPPTFRESSASTDDQISQPDISSSLKEQSKVTSK